MAISVAARSSRSASGFDPAEFHNRYVDALRLLIEEKRKKKGGLVIQDDDKSDPAKGSNVIDLMAALKKSLGGDEATRSDTVKPAGKRPVSKAKPAVIKKAAVAKKRA